MGAGKRGGHRRQAREEGGREEGSVRCSSELGCARSLSAIPRGSQPSGQARPRPRASGPGLTKKHRVSFRRDTSYITSPGSLACRRRPSPPPQTPRRFLVQPTRSPDHGTLTWKSGMPSPSTTTSTPGGTRPGGYSAQRLRPAPSGGGKRRVSGGSARQQGPCFLQVPRGGGSAEGQPGSGASEPAARTRQQCVPCRGGGGVDVPRRAAARRPRHQPPARGQRAGDRAIGGSQQCQACARKGACTARAAPPGPSASPRFHAAPLSASGLNAALLSASTLLSSSSLAAALLQPFTCSPPGGSPAGQRGRGGTQAARGTGPAARAPPRRNPCGHRHV